MPGRGLPQSGGRATWPREKASKHLEDSSQTQGEATAPRRPSSAGRLHSHRDHNPHTNRRPLRAVLCPLSRVAGPMTSLPLRPSGGEETKSSRPFPSRPPPLPSWRPPPRSCPSSYGPFPSCRVLNWLGGSRVRAPAALPACCALRCFSRGAGKGGRKGKSGRSSTQAEEAARVLRGRVYGAAGPSAAVATATAAAILGPYCTGSRYGHVTAPARPSLLYAAGREDERARAPDARARGCEESEPAVRGASPRPRSSVLLLSSGACAWGWFDASLRGAPGATPTLKICLRKRNMIHPGKGFERILTACEAPPWL